MLRPTRDRQGNGSRFLRPLLSALAVVAVVLGATTTVLAWEVHSQHAVWPEFENPWYLGSCSASGGPCIVDTDCPGGETCIPSTYSAGALAFYSGTVVDDAAAACPTDCIPSCPESCRPNNGTHYLQSTAFGQPLAQDIPYDGFIEDAVDTVETLLYYQAGTGQKCCDAGDGEPCNYGSACSGGGTCLDDCAPKAAFRYKDLLYGLDGGNVVNLLETCSGSAPDHCMEWFYGDDERDRTEWAEAILQDALKYAPTNRALRWELLDVYYDRAVAELALAKENLVEAAKIRIFPAVDTPIDDEIGWYGATLGDPLTPGGLRYAIQGYFDLLNQGLGVNTAAVDPDATGDPPFGYYIFQREVPSRSLYAATYIPPGRSDPVPVTDLVWEADTLYAEGTVVQPTVPNGPSGETHVYIATNSGTSGPAEPVWPTGGGGTVVDNEITWMENGTVTIGAPLPLFSGYKDLVLMFGLLRDYADAVVELARLHVMRSGPEDVDPPNGVSDDIDRALELVEETHQRLLLDGHTLLAVFGEETLPGPGHASGVAESVAGWRAGLTRLTEVRDFINGDGNVLGFADDFLALFNDGSNTASYDFLADFLDLIDPQSPLAQAVQAQDDAVAAYGAYRGALDDLRTHFEDKSESYKERLRQIVGVRPGEIGYEPPFDCSPGGVNVGSEICLQTQSIDIALSRIEANRVQQENLRRKVEIEVERRAQEHNIKNAMAGVYVAYGNKQASLTEKISLIESAQAYMDAWANAGSSFNLSDPSFGLIGVAANMANAVFQAGAELGKGQLKKQKEIAAAMERAEIVAQEDALLDNDSKAAIKTWLLEMDELAVDSLEAGLVLGQETARLTALFNEKTDIERRIGESNTALASRYHADPVHRLRMQNGMVDALHWFEQAQKWVYLEAQALEYKWNDHDHDGDWSIGEILRARQAEELEAVHLAMASFDTLKHTFPKDSFTDRLSLRRDVFGYLDGQDYTDPQTGEVVDATEAFRRRVASAVDVDGNLALEFGTAVSPDGSTFFRGPVLNPDGSCCFDPGTWNDKIETLGMVWVGSQSGGQTGYSKLRYGGTSFVRDLHVGLPDPGRPDHVVGEMTAYTTTYWYYDNGWKAAKAFEGPVGLHLKTSGDPPLCSTGGGCCGALSNTSFNERSVATTGWELRIPEADLSLIDLNSLEDIELWVCHELYARPIRRTEEQ